MPTAASCARPPGSRPSPPASSTRRSHAPYPAASSLKARRFPSSTSSQSHPNCNRQGQLRPPSRRASSPPGRPPPLGACASPRWPPCPHSKPPGHPPRARLSAPEINPPASAGQSYGDNCRTATLPRHLLARARRTAGYPVAASSRALAGEPWSSSAVAFSNARPTPPPTQSSTIGCGGGDLPVQAAGQVPQPRGGHHTGALRLLPLRGEAACPPSSASP
jgi:hypothetical protein